MSETITLNDELKTRIEEVFDSLKNVSHDEESFLQWDTVAMTFCQKLGYGKPRVSPQTEVDKEFMNDYNLFHEVYPDGIVNSCNLAKSLTETMNVSQFVYLISSFADNDQMKRTLSSVLNTIAEKSSGDTSVKINFDGFKEALLLVSDGMNPDWAISLYSEEIEENEENEV